MCKIDPSQLPRCEGSILLPGPEPTLDKENHNQSY